MSILRPHSASGTGTRAAGGRYWLRIAAFTLLTLTLALVGQTSSVRDVGQAMPDGVVDRSVGGERGILPGKPSLKVFSEARGSRPTIDRDPSVIVVSVGPSAPAPRLLREPQQTADAGVRPRYEGWTHRPRGPPTEQTTATVESRAYSSHIVVPRMMA